MSSTVTRAPPDWMERLRAHRSYAVLRDGPAPRRPATSAPGPTLLRVSFGALLMVWFVPLAVLVTALAVGLLISMLVYDAGADGLLVLFASAGVAFLCWLGVRVGWRMVSMIGPSRSDDLDARRARARCVAARVVRVEHRSLTRSVVELELETGDRTCHALRSSEYVRVEPGDLGVAFIGRDDDHVIEFRSLVRAEAGGARR